MVARVFGGLLALAVLAAIVFPIFASAKGGSHRISHEMSNLKQCARGLMLYADDFDNVFPYVQTTDTLIAVTRPYIKNDDFWKTYNPKSPGRFHYNLSIPGADLADLEHAAETPMLFDVFAAQRNPRDENSPWVFHVGYADGHAGALREKTWIAVQPNLYLELKRHGRPLAP